MDVKIATDGGSRWGTLTLTMPPQNSAATHLLPGQPARVQGPRYIWRPAPLLAADLPVGFQFAVDCLIAQPNGRFFVPPGSFDNASDFVVQAAPVGIAILRQLGLLDAEQASSYRAMWFLFQHSWRFQEALVRVFHRIADLGIPKPARFEPEEIDILPPALIGDSTNANGRLNVRNSVAMARRRAKKAGYPSPNVDDLIRRDLLKIANSNPIKLDFCTQEQALGLIRTTLFDLGPVSEPIDETVIAEVQGRLIDAMNKHRDDPPEAFNRWFFENFDNIVHQVAKRKRPGGPIERDVVRQALLETVFRAFRYVGDALHAAMRAFADALPEPLDEQEQAAFDAVYGRRSWLGQLPLLLLHRQFPVIQEIVIEILNHPTDERLAGVLLRMLQLHGEMIANKRASERRYKQLSQHRNSEGRVATVEVLDSETSAVCQQQPLLLEIAREICERRRLGCDCRTTVDWHAEPDNDRPRQDEIVITVCCGRCDWSETLEIGRAGRAELAALFESRR